MGRVIESCQSICRLVALKVFQVKTMHMYIQLTFSTPKSYAGFSVWKNIGFKVKKPTVFSEKWQ
jgi:hypothetical protein